MNSKAIKEILKTNASPEIYQDFSKGYKNRMISDILSYVDLAILGTALIMYNVTKTVTPAYRALVFTGVGIFCVGVLLSFAGGSQMKKSIIKYNNSLGTSYKPELYFGLAPNGFIVTYRF